LLRLLKLLYVAELHSHELWRVVPAAVAGETWNAAASIAAAKIASSGSRRAVTPFMPFPLLPCLRIEG
jgi:hypothetical protein